MSIQTWKDEFYPITAQEAAKLGAVAAAEHSLRKWEGALPENTARHGVRVMNEYIVDDNDLRLSFRFDYKSCSLCAMYNANSELCTDEAHVTCPLYDVRGSVPCSQEMPIESTSPYTSMTHSGNPRRMIAWLKLALDIAKSQQAPIQIDPAK